MFRFYPKLVALFLLLLASCQQNGKQNSVIKKDTITRIPNQTLDSLSIDLVALQKEGKLKDTHVITVVDDPVYHSTKRYNALPLSQLLATYTTIKKLNPEKYQIVFECEDGYKPMMPLQKIMDSKAYVAVSDIDAPKGQLWSEIIKDGHQMKAAPFYLIYDGVPANATDYKWPYNLVKIKLVNNSLNIALIAPKDDPKAQAGFALFTKNCVTCHAINKIGGSMGPELNYPKSVTEYWKKDQLKKFIQHPASFRNNVKMPTLTNITPRDIDQIIYYLEYMSKHKI
ncbi:cytochrome c2 [Flavobacterium sp. 7E]|uniref:c-type cytochrome n=1 Tax=Flavobacterium sp. 7E TaxID=2735898 RepID=UPI00157131FF|nr:cytochrome c [Flavobacterium sp. 7E]NRS89050.1 cytochrome c2 [Flavobacterium sp. 7E]